MSIKKMTHANGTQTPDEIIVDYAIKDGDGNVISSTYAKSNNLATVATSGSYNDLTNKPTIPSAPGTLNTTATATQSTSASEALSGAITLHKVSKTGTYSDLIGTPTINTTPTTGTGLWDANTIINYVASRGQQLMTNGTFLLGNNYNFATGTFDGSDSNASGGCVIKAGASTSFKSDEFMPVSKGKTYRLTYDLKPNYDFTTSGPNSAGINGFLPYIDQYDVDKLLIVDYNTNYVSGSLVQLTQDLVSGDTAMHVTDASAWTSYTSPKEMIQIWDYSNSAGYLYPPGTYTRHTYNIGRNSTTDLTTNTINFQTAYSGPTIPAGTYVSQNRGGGYAYIGSYDKPAPNVWSSWTHDSGSTTIRAGCAYAKIGWLWNYNVTSSQALTWDDQTAYNEGWAVKNNNIYYIAKKAVPAGTPLSNTEYWFTKNTSTIPVETKITNIQFTVKSLT